MTLPPGGPGTDVLTIAHQRSGDCDRVILAGELDLATGQQLIEYAASLLADSRELHLDLAGLRFLDPAGLGALLAVRNGVVERGGRVVISRPRPLVRRVLWLGHVDGALPVETPLAPAEVSDREASLLR